MSRSRRRSARGWQRTVIATAAVLLTGATLDAQTGGERFEVGAGMRLVGPEPLGRVDANETNPGGGAFRLFTAESTLDSLLGVEARLGVRVTSALRLEATGSYGSSDLKVQLSGDAEDAPPITATERITQYTVEGAAVIELTRWQVATHGVPFIAAGAGYVRALHGDRILVDEGALWHAGGGLNLVLRSNPASRLGILGVRLDARALFQRGVVSDGVHASPAFGASAFVRF